jgi:RNA polymerase sigma-70 factor (ECF subfamily)
VGFFVSCFRVAIRPSNPLPESSFRDEPESGGARNPAQNDVLLVERMKAGEEAAFALFYDRFAPSLFSVIYAILRDQKESEDVLQEAFVQMWKRAATYDPARSHLFTWAVMISRHKAIDQLRSQRRRSQVTGDLASDAAKEPLGANPDRADLALLQRDERERVRAALAQLSDSQRQVLDLAFFSGMTQAQIAEKLETPLGTVKGRIRHGLIVLRGLLKQDTR